MAIRNCEKRELFALHELLDEYLSSRSAEHTIAEHRVDGPLCFRRTLRHDDAFAASEPGGLDHNGGREISECRLRFLRVAVLRCSSGRNSTPNHQIFGKSLRRLDPRRFARRTKNRQPVRLKEIYYPRLKG